MSKEEEHFESEFYYPDEYEFLDNEYGCPVLTPHQVKDIHEIEKVQIRASRIALGQSRQEMAYEVRLSSRSSAGFLTPVKNPADYDGTQSLRDYLKHFERCSVVNGWNKEDAAVFLAASLRGEVKKVLSGMSDSDCRNYAKIVDKLKLRFGVEKQRELHQARLHNRRQQENESVQALSADIRSMSTLAYQNLSPGTKERFAVQHFIDTSKDRDDRLRLRREKPRTMDEALLLACGLETFRLLDRDRPRSSPKVFSVDEVQSDPDLFKLSSKCYGLTFKHNNNVKRLSKLFSNS
ncbi:uncharacterized protein [Montipora capricornis]|uniref:uncharacterized protein n=1 Tax=Montipora capricornis TaxID=246305 RepID=UPI0035F1BAB7